MPDVYKVWLQIERCNEEEDEYEDLFLPDNLGTFDTVDEAVAFMESLPRKE